MFKWITRLSNRFFPSKPTPITIEDDDITISILINGFLYSSKSFNCNDSVEFIEDRAREIIKPALWKTQIIKTVYVPKDSINFITKLPKRPPAKKIKLQCEVCHNEFEGYPSEYPYANFKEAHHSIRCHSCENRPTPKFTRTEDVTDNKKPMEFVTNARR